MNCKKIFFLAILSGYSFFVYSQNRTDTTKVIADTNAVNALLSLSKNEFGSDPDKAIQYAIQAKQIAEKIDFKKGIALALKNIGIANTNQGKNVDALVYYQQSLKIFKSIQDDNGISNLENNIGALYMNQGDDTKALEYLLKSLKVAERSNNKIR